MNLQSMNLDELSNENLQYINGGILPAIAAIVGIAAGLAYLYEWGYNYAYSRTH